MRIVAAIAGLAVLALSSAAKAENTAKQMLAEIEAGGNSAVMTQVWISGNANGFTWANSELEQRGQRPLFCLPKKLALTIDQEVSILRKFVKERPFYGGVPTGVALLNALQETFPCK